MAAALHQPVFVVGFPQFEQRLPEALDGVEGPDPARVFPDREDEPLRTSIAFRRPDDGSSRIVSAVSGMIVPSAAAPAPAEAISEVSAPGAGDLRRRDPLGARNFEPHRTRSRHEPLPDCALACPSVDRAFKP